jgi:hypothetical protein
MVAAVESTAWYKRSLPPLQHCRSLNIRDSPIAVRLRRSWVKLRPKLLIAKNKSSKRIHRGEPRSLAQNDT